MTPTEKTAIAKVAIAGVAASPANGALVAADSVTELLRMAVERGTPVEQLKELVALHERIEQRQARKAFFAALQAFQSECPSIPHNAKAKITTKSGTEYEYTYADLPHFVKTVSPLLSKHGFSYGWNSELHGETLAVECTLRHVDGHSERAKFSVPTANASAMSPQQKVGAAQTYCERLSLASVLGLTTVADDTDASEVDPSPVTDDQATFIRDLISESNTSEKRFLKWMGVTDVSQIKARDYQRAVNALQRKAQEGTQ